MNKLLAINPKITLIFFLVPVFSGVGDFWNAVNDWYIVLIPLVLLWGLLYKNYKIPNITKDYALLFLFFITLISFFVDFNAGLIYGLNSFKNTDTWTMFLSLLIVFYLSVLKVNYSSFIISSIAGMFIFFFYILYQTVYGDLSFDIFFNSTGYSFMPATVILMLFMSNKRYLSLLLLLITISIMLKGVMLALLVSVLFYYLVYIKNILGSKLSFAPNLAVLVIVLILFIIEVTIGLFFSTEYQSISTGRSIFYNIILEDWIKTGLSIFFPSSSIFSSELITEFTLYTRDDNGFLLYGVAQCPHSILIEIMVDYGIILFCIFFIGFIYSASGLSIIAVLHFLVFASFQCSNFDPIFYVTFYSFYRILLDEEWRFSINTVTKKKTFLVKK